MITVPLSTLTHGEKTELHVTSDMEENGEGGDIVLYADVIRGDDFETSNGGAITRRLYPSEARALAAALKHYAGEAEAGR